MNQPKDTGPGLPITLQGLTKRFGEQFALDTVNLEVGSGEFLTVLGPSGSGKTSLLMAVAGFLDLDAGQIRFGAEDVVTKPPHKRDVGVVFQSYALFGHMSVAENVAFPLRSRNVNGSERVRRVDEALEKVRLSGLGGRRIDQLSGGQQQRVALARAFVFGPRILLMDEPLSALDRKLREQMQGEVKALHRDLGVTTLYVTHDQREALSLSDRVAVIHDGRLLQVGSPEAVHNRPANRFVAEFTGAATLIPLTVGPAGELMFRGQFVAPIPEGGIDQDWTLVLRPERLFFTKAPDEISEQRIVLQGTLQETIFEGETQSAIIDIGDGVTLVLRQGARSGSISHPRGASVLVGVTREDIILVPGHR